MIDKTIVSLINMQIVREQEASHAYKAMEVWCDMFGFDGAKDFYHTATKDEIKHRDMWITYLSDANAQPIIPAVDTPAQKFGSLRAAFQAAYALEQSVTKAINDLYGAALGMSDYVTAQFILWFLDEQRASEAELLKILRWFDAYTIDIAMIDKKIGKLA